MSPVFSVLHVDFQAVRSFSKTFIYKLQAQIAQVMSTMEKLEEVKVMVVSTSSEVWTGSLFLSLIL